MGTHATPASDELRKRYADSLMNTFGPPKLVLRTGVC